MLDAIEKAMAFTRERSKDAVLTDEILGLAIVRLLEIIGEAAKGVTPSTRALAPAIPWKQIAGMRDRLIHGYYEVDLLIVQRVVFDDLPLIVPHVKAVLQTLDREGG